MVRLFRNIAIAATFVALSLIGIGLLIGTMDVSVQASGSAAEQITTRSDVSQVAAKQTLLVQNQEEPALSDEEAAALLQEQVELEKRATELDKRIQQIETKVCLMELDQNGEKKRLSGLLKNLQDRIQARQTSQQQAVATVQKDVCTTCPQQPKPAVQTAPPQTAWTQRSVPQYTTHSSEQSGTWRNSNNYRSNGRRVYFYSSRR